jgi:hypothetical protein
MDLLANTLKSLPALVPARDFAHDIETVIVAKGEPLHQRCEEIEPLLDAFHDQELNAEQREAVVSHIAGCQPCNRALSEIERVVTSLQQLPPAVCQRDFAEDFENILAAKTGVSRAGRPLLLRLAGMAAAIVLLVVSLHSFQTWQQAAPVVGSNSALLEPGRIAVNPPALPSLPAPNDASDPAQVREQSPQARPHRQSLSGYLSQTVFSAFHHHEKAAPSGSNITGQGKDADAHAVESSTAVASANGKGESNPGPADNGVSKRGNDDLIAAWAGEPNPAEELGLATDEDGLYAIKL